MSGHPFLDHPLRWSTTLDAAFAAARARNTAVMVVVGPERCVGTRAFVEKTLCKDEVVEMVAEGFEPLTLVSIDDPSLEALVATLPKREPTPVCLYLSSKGELLLSTIGARPPAVVMNDMMQATHKLSTLASKPA
jgi:hypothetical protein